MTICLDSKVQPLKRYKLSKYGGASKEHVWNDTIYEISGKCRPTDQKFRKCLRSSQILII